MKRWIPMFMVACAIACGESDGTGEAPITPGAQSGAGAGAAGGGGAAQGGRGGAAGASAAGASAAGANAARAGTSGGNAGAGAAGSSDDAGSEDDAGGSAEPDAGAAMPDAGAAMPDAGGDPDSGSSACSECCPDGFPRGTASTTLRKIAPFEPSPEGVAVCPDGEVFVALDGSGELWRVPLDGAAPERWASLGDRRPAGLTCDEEGRLFVAIFSTLSGTTASLGVALVSGRDAAPVDLPQPDDGSKISGLNGIVAVPGVGVYASDTSNGTVVLVRETAPGTFATRIAAKDVDFANGLAYDASRRTLYVVASGAGQVLSFAVAADGALGTRAQVRVGALLLFMDGVAVDEEGTVYVVDYLGGAVYRAGDGRRIVSAANSGQSGFANPASLAFRGGTLLITDYRVMAPDQPGGLYALDLGRCGASD